MDPTKCLQELLGYLKSASVDVPEGSPAHADKVFDIDDAVDRCRALGDWLAAGGHLPDLDSIELP